MAINTTPARAVIFDYGNTLVEFGHAKIRLYDQALAEALDRLFGPPDLLALRAIRDRDRMAPYSGNPPEYRENCLPEITQNLVCSLYGRLPSAAELEEILRVRFESFLEIVEAAREAEALLQRLQGRYSLGLLSNYPDGEAIRASIEKVGLAPFFRSVVVSGDMGFCKPHPLPFERILLELGVLPHEAIFVGDNWLADIQGAKRAGIQAVHMVQWQPHEVFDRANDDFEPDAVVADLNELEILLLS